MKLKSFLTAVVLLLSAVSAQASTVLTVIDGDVNFISWSLGGYTLAMFDNDDMGNMTASNALEVPIPSLVTVTGVSDYTATNSFNELITLTDSSEFILGITNDSGVNWIADNGATDLGGHMYQLDFGEGIEVLTIDVQVSAIPVPAAVWLFGSGLVGLAGMARLRV